MEYYPSNFKNDLIDLNYLNNRIEKNIIELNSKYVINNEFLKNIKFDEVKNILFSIFESKQYKEYFANYFGKNDNTQSYTQKYNTTELDRNIADNLYTSKFNANLIKEINKKILEIELENKKYKDFDLLNESEKELLNSYNEKIQNYSAITINFKEKIEEYENKTDFEKFVFNYLNQVNFNNEEYKHKMFTSYFDSKLDQIFHYTENKKNKEFLEQMLQEIEIEEKNINNEINKLKELSRKRIIELKEQQGLLKYKEEIQKIQEEKQKAEILLNKYKNEKIGYIESFVETFIEKFLDQNDYDVIINNDDNPIGMQRYSTELNKLKETQLKIKESLSILNSIKKEIQKIQEKSLDSKNILNLIKKSDLKQKFLDLKILDIIQDNVLEKDVQDIFSKSINAETSSLKQKTSYVKGGKTNTNKKSDKNSDLEQYKERLRDIENAKRNYLKKEIGYENDSIARFFNS